MRWKKICSKYLNFHFAAVQWSDKQMHIGKIARNMFGIKSEMLNI